MSHTHKFSSPPLHPLFHAVLPDALAAAVDGKPGLIELHPRGGLALGRLRTRPADDRILCADLADAARLAGVGAIRFSDGVIAIPDLDGVFGHAAPFAELEAASRALALARTTLLLASGQAALIRAEIRRRATLARRVAQAIRVAAPAAGEALRGLSGQLELACHLHELPAGANSPLLGVLADGRALREVAGEALDRAGLRALTRPEAVAYAPATDWAARDARLDRVLDAYEAPRAARRA